MCMFMQLTHHTRQAALHLRVGPIAVVIAVVTGRPGRRIRGAVWTGGHVGAHLSQLGCDQLYTHTR